MSTVIFLLQTLVIIAVPFGISRALRLKSVVPLVVVQIAVGVALGPSVFGRMAPETFATIFNPTTLAPLSGISSIAVLLFAFTTGIHFDPRSITGRGRGFAIVAGASVIIPTLCGILVGLWIAGRFPSELNLGVTSSQFAIAIGICMGVTALPVLGSILREMRLTGQRIGQIALGLAAVSDVALWLYLSLLITASKGPQAEGSHGYIVLVLLPMYLLAMIFVARPFLVRLVTNRLVNGRIGENSMIVVCAVAIGSSAMTEAMGLHYLFGAFMAGAIMPRELREPILDRLQIVTAGVLMPFFFILTGLRTTINLDSPAFLEIFLVASAAAVISKVGATAVFARLTGESWRVALAVGSLMQTKGLMEVVILTVLLQTGIITPTVFSAFLMMALLCTALTMPMTRLALAKAPRERHIEQDIAATVGLSSQKVAPSVAAQS